MVFSSFLVLLQFITQLAVIIPVCQVTKANKFLIAEPNICGSSRTALVSRQPPGA